MGIAGRDDLVEVSSFFCVVLFMPFLPSVRPSVVGLFILELCDAAFYKFQVTANYFNGRDGIEVEVEGGDYHR